MMRGARTRTRWGWRAIDDFGPWAKCIRASARMSAAGARQARDRTPRSGESLENDACGFDGFSLGKIKVCIAPHLRRCARRMLVQLKARGEMFSEKRIPIFLAQDPNTRTDKGRPNGAGNRGRILQIGGRLGIREPGECRPGTSISHARADDGDEGLRQQNELITPGGESARARCGPPA